MSYDVLITNAQIVDGTGAPAWRGSLAIKDGTIAALDADPRLADAAAREVVDAHGDVLSPGFIDLHSHADFSIQGSPAAETQLMQGVTTVVTGNCGASTFPARDLNVIRRASAQFDAVFLGDWGDADGFAAATNAQTPGVNLVRQVGHTTVRAHVLGMANRAATDEELQTMSSEIRTAAEQGARGFTSGLVYAPGSFAGQHELNVLARVAAESELLYSTHMRNESGELINAVKEAISTAEHAGARLEISHLKAMGPANHGRVVQALRLIDAARERGVDVAADVYPYTASSTTLTSRLPAFAMDGGLPALMQRLSDSRERALISERFSSRFGKDVDPAGLVVAALGPARHGQPEADFTWSAGLSIAEIGLRLGCSPQEAAMRLLEGHGGAVAIVNHSMSADDVAAVLVHPQTSVASDGWTLSTSVAGVPHPRSFGTFARVLREYVRERNLLTLENAVRKMTSLPASRIRLSDRGVLATGKVADLTRFDAGLIADRSTYADPKRLAVGVSDVWVGGSRAVRAGVVTVQRFGAVI